MVDQVKKPGFVSTLKNFFGFLPGQGASQFAGEVKKLSYAEKMEFHRMLVASGNDCEEPINNDKP